MVSLTRNARRFAAVAMVWLGAAPLGAQGHRLSGPLAEDPPGEVGWFAVAPDGARAAFQLGDGLAEDGIFGVRLDAVEPAYRLCAGSEDVLQVPQLSGDGAHVVYRHVVADRGRLESVPLAGGQPIVLDPAGVANSRVSTFAVAPDGARIVFIADDEFDGSNHLYSVPIDGSQPPRRLSKPLPIGGDVKDFAISPDGARVVYRGDQDVDGVIDLYSVPIDGSAAPVELDRPRPLADVDEYAIAFDSLGVVFIDDQDTDELFELYAVPIDGSLAPAKRNGTLQPNGDVLDFVLSPVDDRLVYRANAVFDERSELYATHAIAGGTPQQLSAVAIGDTVADATFSSDAAFVAYRVDAGPQLDLYSVPADGSAPGAEIAAAIVSYRVSGTRALFVSSFSIALWSAPLDHAQPPVNLEGTSSGGNVRTIVDVLADGTVLFTADAHDFRVNDLYRAPSDASSSPVRLSGPLPTHGGVLDAAGSAAGARVVYLAHQDHALDAELYLASASGGAARRISPEIHGPLVGAIEAYQFAADGARVVYSARAGAFGPIDLFSVEADGGRAIQLDRSYGEPSLAFQDFTLAPDGSRAFYRLASSFRSELFSARVDAGRSAVRLDRNTPQNDLPHLNGYAVTPDSSRVVFSADLDGPDEYDLFVVPADGSGPAVNLGAGAGFARQPADPRISPDGAWVVYRFGQDLYSLPLDGHQPPVQLNAVPVAGGSVDPGPFGFALSADSSRVVYLADQDVEEQFELYSVPIDGSAAAVRLNGPMQPDGDVVPLILGNETPYTLSPDGARVAYLADQDQDGMVELYSAPIDGSTAAVKVSGPMQPNGDVVASIAIAIDSASSRVVYAADEETDTLVELYSAPLDGSSAPVKLSGALNAAGDVDAFRLGVASSAGTVVYRADALVNNVHELFQVPLAGGAAPVRVNAPLAAGGDVLANFAFTPDGASVVYAAEQRFAGVRELFAAPLDGSRAPRILSGEMTPGGNVISFRISPDGEHVVYRADQETDGVFELFGAVLERAKRRAGAPAGLR